MNNTCHVLGGVTIFRICHFVFFCILNLTLILTRPNPYSNPNPNLNPNHNPNLFLIQTLILTLKV
jgi:heme/copper-type cytochrome/quinol oxidase subunit 3